MLFSVPVGDDRKRFHCPNCSYIHYENPRIQVSLMMNWEDKLLLMRRATDPGKNGWALPGGFMEMGETPRQAAARELREETGISLDPGELSIYMVGSLGPMDQVFLSYRGTLSSPHCEPGPEALEVRFFTEAEYPWRELAFAPVPDPIKAFYEDIRAGKFGVYHGEFHSEHEQQFWRVQ